MAKMVCLFLLPGIKGGTVGQRKPGHEIVAVQGGGLAEPRVIGYVVGEAGGEFGHVAGHDGQIQADEFVFHYQASAP